MNGLADHVLSATGSLREAASIPRSVWHDCRLTVPGLSMFPYPDGLETRAGDLSLTEFIQEFGAMARLSRLLQNI